MLATLTKGLVLNQELGPARLTGGGLNLPYPRLICAASVLARVEFDRTLNQEKHHQSHLAAFLTQWTEEVRMEPLNIQKLASKCAASFKARFQDRLLDPREEEIEERDVLETQNARFNLWADNIGE